MDRSLVPVASRLALQEEQQWRFAAAGIQGGSLSVCIICNVLQPMYLLEHTYYPEVNEKHYVYLLTNTHSRNVHVFSVPIPGSQRSGFAGLRPRTYLVIRGISGDCVPAFGHQAGGLEALG